MKPNPPESAPKYLREGLDSQSPETLREIAAYADVLADHKESEAQRELEERAADVDDETPEEWDADEWDDATDDLEAPASATLTIKKIDGRRYYYYQWREGSKIKSEYVAPVTPSDN